MKSPVNENVILASGSPRRRQLLEYIVPRFTVAPARDIDETFPADLPADRVAEFLASLKSAGYADLATPGNLVITADTVVILDNKILGKPHSRAEAVEMLRSLAGRTHKVITGVAIRTADSFEAFSETTEVTFGTVSDRDIAAYVDEFNPLDKAGAYGIQEWIGCVAITSIHGCYYNVMGLPLHSLYQHLRRF